MTVSISSTELIITFTPERGADIVSVIDRKTGIEVLAQSPTGRVSSGKRSFTDSMTNWIDGYPGGWQLLIPNAGPERDHDGVLQGYHGEASLARWELQEIATSTAVLETYLLTVPFRLNRIITVEGGTLLVTDTVTNLSPGEVSFRFVQHPALGHPFLHEHSYLVTEARTVISDARLPGNLSGANVSGEPSTVLAEGPVKGSIALPGPGTGVSFFGALTNFDTSDNDGNLTQAVFYSPTQGFGISLEWDASALPHAWLWIEANSVGGWPWFQRMYSLAVEPSNVFPGDGMGPHDTPRGGPGTLIGGGQSFSTQTRMSRVPLPVSPASDTPITDRHKDNGETL
jgi:hypothetical protein